MIANGPTDEVPEQGRLFEEIGRLKRQRNQLQRDLAECRRQNDDLRRQLARFEASE